MPIPQVTDRIKEAPAVALRAVFAGIGQLLMVVDKIRAQMQEQATSSAPAGQKGPGAAQPARRPTDETGNVALLHERPTAAAPRPAAARADATGTRPAPAAPKPAAPKPAAAHQPAAPKQATAHTKPSAPKPSAPKPGTAPATRTKPTVATKPASAPAAKPAETPKATAPKPSTAPKPTSTSKPTTAPKPTSPPKPAAAPEARAATPAATIGKPAPAASAAAQAAPIPGYDALSIASLRARLRGLDAAGVHALLDYEKANAHRDDVITMFERRLSKIGDGAS
jgi:hypothetical protein